MGEERGIYRILVGRLEGKRPLGRPRRRWEDNIKMDLRAIGIDGANWIQLAQDRDQCWALVNTVMSLRILELLYQYKPKDGNYNRHQTKIGNSFTPCIRNNMRLICDDD
jgi:hypothetical protein